MPEHTPATIAVVNDLMFASRIRAAADQAGMPITFARSSAALHELAPGATLLLLDLNTRWLEPADEIRAVKALAPGLRIIAFGSHLAVDALDAAREAGADRVMANSALVRELPGILRA